MGRFATETPVRVRVGDCLCPGTPHSEGDFVTLSTRMSIEAGAAAVAAMARSGEETTELTVMRAALPHMVTAWDFLDAETGEPLPITPDNVTEALPWNYGGREVVIALSEALAERPLSLKPSRNGTVKPSARTRTASTSRKARSSSPLPVP